MTIGEKVMLCSFIYNVVWFVNTDILFIEILTGVTMIVSLIGFVLFCGRNRDDGESPN